VSLVESTRSVPSRLVARRCRQRVRLVLAAPGVRSATVSGSSTCISVLGRESVLSGPSTGSVAVFSMVELVIGIDEIADRLAQRGGGRDRAERNLGARRRRDQVELHPRHQSSIELVERFTATPSTATIASCALVPIVVPVAPTPMLSAARPGCARILGRGQGEGLGRAGRALEHQPRAVRIGQDRRGDAGFLALIASAMPWRLLLAAGDVDRRSACRYPA
jgi:hypothetical protein